MAISALAMVAIFRSDVTLPLACVNDVANDFERILALGSVSTLAGIILSVELSAYRTWNPGIPMRSPAIPHNKTVGYGGSDGVNRHAADLGKNTA